MNQPVTAQFKNLEIGTAITKETELITRISEALERLVPLLESDLLAQGSKGPGPGPGPGPGGELRRAVQLLLGVVAQSASDLQGKVGQLGSSDARG